MSKLVVNISLDLEAYQNLEDFCRVLGLSCSRVVCILLKDPSNALALKLAYEIVKSFKKGGDSNGRR